MKEYNPKEIEKKWQKVWENTKLYRTDLNATKPKHYNLVMFPYPSGEYLHMGHGYSYPGADIYGRYKLLKGFNVFQPIGYDAFGLPAENFAIKAGVHPKESTRLNIEHAESQLKSWGCIFDFSREVTTSEPDYYKWTQWIFLQLYKQGLAYQKEAPVNWCPKCLTVLAHEQVIDGLCERCETEVVQKMMKQWFFKITDYAERLIKDLDKVDWPESSIIKQRNWIGKSEGVQFEMAVEGQKEKIEVYTTRIDTVFGTTYVVLAPEHPLVSKIVTKNQQKEVEKYQTATQKKSELERQSLDKEKAGVFTGAYAINPFNNEKVPIWISDYVIFSYGAGAVMAVPAHDARDFEFAQKYNLPIRKVVDPHNEFQSLIIKESVDIKRFLQGLNNLKMQYHNYYDWGLRIYGRPDHEEKYIKLVQETLKKGPWYVDADGSLKVIIFKDKSFKLPNEQSKAEEYARQIGVPEEQIDWQKETTYGYCFDRYGTLVNSGEFTSLTSEQAKKRMAYWLEEKKIGSKKINYRLRDWSFSRQRYWGAPIPIIYCEKCGIQPFPEKDLPVLLPELSLEQVRPKGTGKGPLANDPSFVNTTCPKCGGKAERETDTMDTFVCSSFYFLRYPNVGDDTKMMNPEITKKWLPIDMYVGGAEHVTMHLLYARFITKALYDAKMITFDEPFSSLRHQGMILGPDGKKMSKSKGNVVIPNEVIDKDGADSFRTYILFMGPFEDGGPWNPKGLIGIRRFLEKYWRLSQEVIENLGIENPEQNIYSSKEIEGTALKRAVSKTVKKVGEDIESFKFNTAISSLMECLNSMYEFKGKQPIKELTHDWKEALKNYTIILSPFAPHIAEEVWESLGEKESIFRASWPFVEEKLIEEETITIPIQINGKVRGEILIAKGLDQKKVEKEALANEKIKKYTEGKEIKRVIYVKDKLLSIVI